MKNEYRKDFEGKDVLVLNHDGSVSTDIQIENRSIGIFTSYDYYDSNYTTIPLEDWEEVKAFVDNQIRLMKDKT